MTKQPMNDPHWWTDDHTAFWTRVKDAMKRDWEQTKAHLSQNDGAKPGYVPPLRDINGGGTDLNQDVVHTVKQALGSETIPPPEQPNAALRDFNEVAPAYRYGAGLSTRLATEAAWTPELEATLEEEWFQMEPTQPWEVAKPHVRRGFEQSRKS